MLSSAVVDSVAVRPHPGLADVAAFQALEVVLAESHEHSDPAVFPWDDPSGSSD